MMTDIAEAVKLRQESKNFLLSSEVPKKKITKIGGVSTNDVMDSGGELGRKSPERAESPAFVKNFAINE
jgi:hypothetical protein